MLQNVWYVGATSKELGDAPVERVICGQPVVLFRDESGTACAVQNYCSHRRAPLSGGRVIGDAIECPYHGMQFNGAGRCVLIPLQSDIPDRAHIRAYPVVERQGFIWIWPGEPSLADPSSILDLPWREDPAWNADAVHFYHVKGSHVLMNDNLLDLGHVAFIHADTIGFNATGLEEDPLQTRVEGDTIVNTRIFPAVKPAPTVATWGNFEGLVERTSISTWRPPCFTSITFRNRDARQSIELKIDHLITPETERTHNYWVSVCRNFRIDDDALTEKLREDNDRVHFQDLEIVEEQQRMIDMVPDYRDMPLRQDRALTIAHRTLARLEKAERAAPSAAEEMQRLSVVGATT